MATDTVPTLVDPDWLAARLDAPDLRVVDCTVHLAVRSGTGDYRLDSGEDDWRAGHVPGGVFADLIEDLSETEDPAYPFELPSPAAFASGMERLGIGDDTRVVVYDAASEGSRNMWAARLWWLLRVFGHDRVGVLDGGWERWVGEDRPVESGAAEPTPEVEFTPAFRPELVADRGEVADRAGAGDACVINALRPADHAAERVPGSVNVPAVGEDAIVDTETGTYLPPSGLRERFEAAGATDADRVITYCGAGVAASSAALGLHLAGVEDAAVYDGSLSEWLEAEGTAVATD